MAETNSLLNCRRGTIPYRGFESPSLRKNINRVEHNVLRGFLLLLFSSQHPDFLIKIAIRFFVLIDAEQHQEAGKWKFV